MRPMSLSPRSLLGAGLARACEDVRVPAELGDRGRMPLARTLHETALCGARGGSGRDAISIEPVRDRLARAALATLAEDSAHGWPRLGLGLEACAVAHEAERSARYGFAIRALGT